MLPHPTWVGGKGLSLFIASLGCGPRHRTEAWEEIEGATLEAAKNKKQAGIVKSEFRASSHTSPRAWSHFLIQELSLLPPLGEGHLRGRWGAVFGYGLLFLVFVAQGLFPGEPIISATFNQHPVPRGTRRRRTLFFLCEN